MSIHLVKKPERSPPSHVAIPSEAHAESSPPDALQPDGEHPAPALPSPFSPSPPSRAVHSFRARPPSAANAEGTRRSPSAAGGRQLTPPLCDGGWPAAGAKEAESTFEWRHASSMAVTAAAVALRPRRLPALPLPLLFAPVAFEPRWTAPETARQLSGAVPAAALAG